MEKTSGVVDGNSQNQATAVVPRTFSTFPLEYHMFDTHRFGEYHPHYVEEGVKNDILPVRSSHQVMSYTLKSPLMQNITMYKDYFNVPMEAILPMNWEKFFDNPVRGDDVPNDVGPSVEGFWSKVAGLMSALSTSLTTLLANTSTSNNDAFAAALRFLVIGEYFYSNGSLLSSLGCHGAPYLNLYRNGIDPCSWDIMFDEVLADIAYSLNGDTFNLTVDGYTYVVKDGVYRSRDDRSISLRHALSLIRDNLVFTVSLGATSTMRSDLDAAFSNFTLQFFAANVPLDMSRVWAYQLVCSHYYTNDHIDFIYSAELYRQLIGNYVSSVNSGYMIGTSRYFTRNGIRYHYDYLSAHFCGNFILFGSANPSLVLSAGSSGGNSAVPFLGYLSAVFAYRRSLRYQDYFTGSRSQPLAVGSTGVSVSGNTVDVVDITRNIQRQRFLNAVNRVRHSFEGYLKGIFGGEIPAPDYHNPFFLASTKDDIYGQETENTATDQMTANIAITTNLRSNGSRYMLEIRPDRPSVIIGITHYDLPRVYGRSTERMMLHVDRFDMFNPFMQYIGDQPVYIQELGINPNGTALLNMSNFAYGLRHMEYKQRFNQAAGGFVENLTGWCFLASDRRGNQATINPDWIRSVPSEIDDFYVSLTGYSNGSYWHFIVDNFNDCSGQRPMAYAPSIL